MFLFCTFCGMVAFLTSSGRLFPKAKVARENAWVWVSCYAQILSMAAPSEGFALMSEDVTMEPSKRCGSPGMCIQSHNQKLDQNLVINELSEKWCLIASELQHIVSTEASKLALRAGSQNVLQSSGPEVIVALIHMGRSANTRHSKTIKVFYKRIFFVGQGIYGKYSIVMPIPFLITRKFSGVQIVIHSPKVKRICLWNIYLPFKGLYCLYKPYINVCQVIHL